jgi:hypothetical protein
MNSASIKDNRRFTRIPFSAVVKLTAGSSWQCELLDVSLKGALLSRPAGWQGKLGDKASLELRPENSDIVIVMNGEVAHVETARMGLRCTDIDVESISHLKRLVELNLGNADQLTRELHALISP